MKQPSDALLLFIHNNFNLILFFNNQLPRWGYWSSWWSQNKNEGIRRCYRIQTGISRLCIKRGEIFINKNGVATSFFHGSPSNLSVNLKIIQHRADENPWLLVSINHGIECWDCHIYGSEHAEAVDPLQRSHGWVQHLPHTHVRNPGIDISFSSQKRKNVVNA